MLLIATALSLGSVLYTKARLEFHTGQDELITPNSRASRDYLGYIREFPGLDGLIIVVRAAPDTARAEHFADALAARLNADHANVKAVFYKIDAGAFAHRAMLYMQSADLDALAQKIRAAFPILRAYAAGPSLAGFFATVNSRIDRQMRAQNRSQMHRSAGRIDRAAAIGHPHASHGTIAAPPTGAPPARDEFNIDMSAIDTLLRGMLADAESSRYVSPWQSMVQAGGAESAENNGYLVSDNGRYLLIRVTPGDGVKDGIDPIEAIESGLDAVRASFPGVQAGMTGWPALARAERTTITHDIALAALIAIVSIVMLLVIAFSAVVEPFFAVLAVLPGAAWTFGFTTLVIGHLNLRSAVFISVLTGIGINFPIHLMTRYDEALRRGATSAQAVELAVVGTGTGVFASACVMALAFLTLVFTDFRGIAELGIASAAGLFLCLASALLVFPALVVLRDRYRPGRTLPQLAPRARASILEAAFRRPALIVAGAVALTVGGLVLTGRMSFDQNQLKLQPEQTEAAEFENLPLKDSERSSWFAVSLAPSMEAAEERAAAFRKLPEVSGVETIATYIPDSQTAKLKTLDALSAMLAPIEVVPFRRPSDPAVLARELSRLWVRLELIAPADNSGATATTAALVRAALARLRIDRLAFASYEASINADLRARLDGLKHDLEPGEVTAANLPKEVRERFVGRDGRFLVQIYPRGGPWEDAALSRFIGALKSVDTGVTGPLVESYNVATVMRRSYERAAVLALIAVLVFVFADFRNLRDAALATVPLLFGGAWLLEAMGGLGWRFDLANLFAFPILIGIGVGNGVNLLYSWREERDKSALILNKAAGKSVTISSLTAVAGFAALIPAEQSGASSLGWVLSLGVTLILVATLVVLPALFELMGRRIAGGRIEPPAPAAEEKVPAPRKAASGGLRG